MRALQKIFAIILLTQLSFVATADDENPTEVACGPDAAAKIQTSFKGLKKLAMETSNQLCTMLIKPNPDKQKMQSILLRYSFEAQKEIGKSYPAKKFPEFTEALNKHREKLNALVDKNGIFKGDLHDMIITAADIGGPPPGVQITSFSADEAPPVSNDDEYCRSLPGNHANCVASHKDLAKAFNVYSAGRDQLQYNYNKQKLTYLQSSWDRYLEKAREQTFIDVWATTIINRNHYKQDRLVEPHPVQYFLLRPQLVYEFNDSAKNGDRSQVGLAIEWFGANLWDWKVPLGLSLASVYADYEEEKSVGLGLMLTVNNNLSIGWVDRDDSDGVYVTMDLLKLWQDKSATIDQYRKDPWAFFK